MASKTGTTAGRGGAGLPKASQGSRMVIEGDGLTYATIPPELLAPTRAKNGAAASSTAAGRHDPGKRQVKSLNPAPPAIQRAPSPFNAPASADALQASIGLPPSAFTLTGAPQASYSLPPIPGLLPRAGTSNADNQLAEGYIQPPSRLTSLHTIIQQGQSPGQADPHAEVDRWRAQVDAETNRSGKRALNSDDEVALADPDVDPRLSKASASTDAVRPASSLSPAMAPKPTKGKPATQKKPTKDQDAGRPKKAPKRKRVKEDEPPSGNSPEHAISSKALVKMLPKRRKVFGRAKENEAESADETDYEDVSSPPHRRRGATKKRVAALRPAGKAVDEVKERKRKGSEPDDSETERRKEKARQKWQEIDDFELEVLPTL
ncbi:hypothetical protein JCM10296v2_000278 [Rhodotorula toruloides]